MRPQIFLRNEGDALLKFFRDHLLGAKYNVFDSLKHRKIFWLGCQVAVLQHKRMAIFLKITLGSLETLIIHVQHRTDGEFTQCSA